MAPLRPRSQRRSTTSRPFSANTTDGQQTLHRDFDNNQSLLANSQLFSEVRAQLAGLIAANGRMRLNQNVMDGIANALAAAMLTVAPAAWSMEEFTGGELILDDTRQIAIAQNDFRARLHRLEEMPNKLEGTLNVKSAASTLNLRRGNVLGELRWLNGGEAAGLVEAKPVWGQENARALTGKAGFGEMQKWILGEGSDIFLQTLDRHLRHRGVQEPLTQAGIRSTDLVQACLRGMAIGAAGTGDYLNRGTKRGNTSAILGATDLPADIERRLELGKDRQNILGGDLVPDGRTQIREGLIAPGKVVRVLQGDADLVLGQRLGGKRVKMEKGAMVGYQAALGRRGLAPQVAIGFRKGTVLEVVDVARILGTDSPEAAQLSVAIQQGANGEAPTKTRAHTLRVKPLLVDSGWRAA